jgi:hypothetical protein
VNAVSGDRLVRILTFIAEYAAARHTVVSSRATCDACVRLTAVDGAGLTLMNGSGRGDSRYTTDLISAALEDLQFTVGEGPAMDAFRSGLPVLIPDLDSAAGHRRWPVFTPAAVQAGARAVFVFPVRSGAARLGVLGLHRVEPGLLTADQVSDTLVVADVVLSMLLDELTPLHRGPGRYQVPLNRAEIHQATGMVSAQLEVTVEEALVRLRAYAFVHDEPIAAVAKEIVARRLRLKADPA